MLTLPKSLPNRDALSRKSVNGWRTLPYICAVPVPNETNKEQIGTIAHSEQIKTNSAEFLWIWCGIKPPLLPDKPITADSSVEPYICNCNRAPLNRTAPTTRQRQ